MSDHPKTKVVWSVSIMGSKRGNDQSTYTHIVFSCVGGTNEQALANAFEGFRKSKPGFSIDSWVYLSTEVPND